MDPELTALTSTAANTLVQLLATSAWEQVKSAMGGLWRRVHPGRAEMVQADLEESRVEVLAARQAGDEQVEHALVDEWQNRLRRLMCADPQLVGELRRVVMKLGSALAEAESKGTTITQRATTSDGSRVYQAGGDMHVIIRE